MTFFILKPHIVNCLTFADSVVNGDTLNQDVTEVVINPGTGDTQYVTVTPVGVGGLWAGVGVGYWGLTHLNVVGNEFYQMKYGVWQDNFSLYTAAKHSSIVGNRFEDFGDPTPGSGAMAAGVYYTSNGAQPGIKSVNIAHNHFVNECDDASYKYGVYLDNAIFFPSIGENWY